LSSKGLDPHDPARADLPCALHRPAIDDLTVLLPAWRTDICAPQRRPFTITSYKTVGTNLLAWLAEQGMPAIASASLASTLRRSWPRSWTA
jgi:hypothetical protein